TMPGFLSVAAFRVPAAERNSSSENPAYFRSQSGLKLIGQKGIAVVGRETEVDGVRAEVDGVCIGVGGSVGGREATKCCTAPRNTSTIFSIGSERNCSISGSVRGWLVLTFWQCISHCSGVRALSVTACSGVS